MLESALNLAASDINSDQFFDLIIIGGGAVGFCRLWAFSAVIGEAKGEHHA